MESTERKDCLIESVVDHCRAFSIHLEPLAFRKYPSEFPRELIRLLDSMNSAIQEKLGTLPTDPDFLSLTEEEAEQHIIRYSQLYSYLYVAASLIERADVHHTVPELSEPIKRLMRIECGLQDFELLLHPLPILNYSFFPLGLNLSLVHQQLGLEIQDADFPKHLVAIGFPGLEIGRFLAHCMVAHELGHSLYLEHQLNNVLLPLVKPDQSQLDALVHDLAQAPLGTTSQESNSTATPNKLADYINVVELTSSITHEINNVAKLWVKELTSDALGYYLFGPAYLFAALEVMASLAALDSEQETHPPNRMRFLLLFKMLSRETDYLSAIGPKAKDYLELWRLAVEDKPPEFTHPIHHLAGNAILGIYDDIISTAESVTGNPEPYSASGYSTELRRLLDDRISRFAPPNELIVDGKCQTVRFQSVVNAGWLGYLTQLESLRQKFGWEIGEAKVKYNELIAKAVELNEVQRRWGEVY